MGMSDEAGIRNTPDQWNGLRIRFANPPVVTYDTSPGFRKNAA